MKLQVSTIALPFVEALSQVMQADNYVVGIQAASTGTIYMRWGNNDFLSRLHERAPTSINITLMLGQWYLVRSV